MEKEIVFVLLDDFADWEAAFLATAAAIPIGLWCRGRKKSNPKT